MTSSIIKHTKYGENVNALPPADVLLWSKICSNMIPSLRFSREAIIGEHIISICCRSAKLAVEFDMPPEQAHTAQDIARIHALKERNYSILYLRSEEIYKDPNAAYNGVILAARQNQETIVGKIKQPYPVSANLSHRLPKRRVA
jgi:very-short-patch-repair endonuclease